MLKYLGKNEQNNPRGKMGAKTEILNIFSQLTEVEQQKVIDFARKLHSLSQKKGIDFELSILNEVEIKHLESEFANYKELYPKNE